MLVLDQSMVQRVDEDSKKLEIAQIAKFLQDNVGQKITAYLSGLKAPKEVGSWSSGKVAPHQVNDMRLREAYHALRIIAEVYGANTARSWLIGSNSRLDNEAPAWILRYAKDPEDLRGLVAAALVFAGGQD